MRTHVYAILELLDLSEGAQEQLIKLLFMTSQKTTSNMERIFIDGTMVLKNSLGNHNDGVGITMMSGYSKNTPKIQESISYYSKVKKYQQNSYTWIGLINYVDEDENLINDFILYEGVEEYNSFLEEEGEKFKKFPITNVK